MLKYESFYGEWINKEYMDTDNLPESNETWFKNKDNWDKLAINLPYPYSESQIGESKELSIPKQIEHEEKRVHYSVSNMFLERLQAQFPDNWLDILNDGMVYEFKQWERGIYSNMYQEGFFS